MITMRRAESERTLIPKDYSELFKESGRIYFWHLGKPMARMIVTYGQPTMVNIIYLRNREETATNEIIALCNGIQRYVRNTKGLKLIW